MHDEAVEAIKNLSNEAMELKEVDGKKYSPVTLKRVYSDPRPDALRIKSLEGIMDYLTANIDNLDIDELILHIIDYETVCILTNVRGEKNQRHVVIQAGLGEFDSFPFDRYIGQEQFIIKMRAMFNSTTDLESIIRYTSKIDQTASVVTEDDGITQNVNIKQGQSGAMTERETIPSLVVLEPYRTFSEAEQPASQFLFRMKTEDEVVKCALFEADGGAWRSQARQNIAQYFSEREIEIPVIA